MSYKIRSHLLTTKHQFDRLFNGDETAIEPLMATLSELGTKASGGNNYAIADLQELAYAIAYERFESLLKRKYPYLLNQHSVASAISESYPKLEPKEQDALLFEGTIQGLTGYLNKLAYMVRFVLIDMVNRQRNWDKVNHADLQAPTTPQGVLSVQLEPAAPTVVNFQTYWQCYHAAVDSLPSDERRVFVLHYMLDLTQLAIAKLTNLSPRQVSRLWVSATERLSEVAREFVNQL